MTGSIALLDLFFRAKKKLELATPDAYYHIRRWYWRRQRSGESTLAAISRSFIEKHGLTVQNGPFKGVAYIAEACGSALLPKLTGSYEAELHGVIETALARQNETIVDVGCAEGYYAVGFAVRSPNSRVYAFDIDDRARQLCRRMSQANGVGERVIIGGECTCERLGQLIAGGAALIICDCEGYEDRLLRTDLIPSLSRCTIIAELHDFMLPGLTERIQSRFTGTHNVTVIGSTKRDWRSYPALAYLNRHERNMALAERRRAIGMRWAYMTPHVP